jgi:hypothetical protein
LRENQNLMPLDDKYTFACGMKIYISLDSGQEIGQSNCREKRRRWGWSSSFVINYRQMRLMGLPCLAALQFKCWSILRELSPVEHRLMIEHLTRPSISLSPDRIVKLSSHQPLLPTSQNSLKSCMTILTVTQSPDHP